LIGKGGTRQGWGLLFTRNSVYAGEFVSGEKHGQGRLEGLLKRDITYIGSFQKNKKHGQGKLIVFG
jgi:hypothetical protein